MCPKHGRTRVLFVYICCFKNRLDIFNLTNIRKHQRPCNKSSNKKFKIGSMILSGLDTILRRCEEHWHTSIVWKGKMRNKAIGSPLNITSQWHMGPPFNGALGDNFYDKENEMLNKTNMRSSRKGGKGGANIVYTLLIWSTYLLYSWIYQIYQNYHCHSVHLVYCFCWYAGSLAKIKSS